MKIVKIEIPNFRDRENVILALARIGVKVIEKVEQENRWSNPKCYVIFELLNDCVNEMDNNSNSKGT